MNTDEVSVTISDGESDGEMLRDKNGCPIHIGDTVAYEYIQDLVFTVKNFWSYRDTFYVNVYESTIARGTDITPHRLLVVGISKREYLDRLR